MGFFYSSDFRRITFPLVRWRIMLGDGGILTLKEKRKKMSLCYVAQNYWLDNSIKNPVHMKNFQKGSTQYFVRKERLGNFISPLQVILLSYFRLLLLKFESRIMEITRNSDLTAVQLRFQFNLFKLISIS